MSEYIANAGQTYFTIQENINVDFVLFSQKQHFLPGVKMVPNYMTDHEDYEASQWPVFLPKLYDLWKDHPDPSQNVHCCLKVERTENGAFRYVCQNGPVYLEVQK